MKTLRINTELCDELAIVRAEGIQEIELSEAYTRYGIKWGEEYENEYADAINYHDGNNWRTLFVGNNHAVAGDLEYIEQEQEKEILALYEEISSGDWEDCGNGMKSCEKGEYKFILSSWASDSWNIVRVKEL